MTFDENLASTTNCGDLTPVGYPYNIEKQASSVCVLVHNDPKPFTLIMRPDGGFTGPGLISVTGKVITGYDSVTKTQMIDGRAAMFNECNGPCQTTSRTPTYSPKTERCSVGSLSAPPKRKPQPAQPAGGNGGHTLRLCLALQQRGRDRSEHVCVASPPGHDRARAAAQSLPRPHDVRGGALDYS